MESALQIAKGLLLKLIFNPEAGLEFWIAVSLSVIVFLVVYTKVGDLMEVQRAGGPTSLFIGLIGLVLYVFVTTLILHYAGSELSKAMEERLPVAVGIVLSIVLICPVIGFLQQSKYLTTLFNWVAGVAAFLLVAFVISLIFDVIGHSKKTVDKEKQRQEQLQDY